MKPLQILCSSTRQWNPGDEWIAAGIRRLFRGLYPDRILNWVLYDRNPDCFVEAWRSPERRHNLQANSLQPAAALPPVDLIVIAGTPEWLGPHIEPLAALRETSKAPVFYLGIDYPSTNLPLSPNDWRMLDQAFIVTRGPIAAQALRAAGLEPHTMPCPALFSAPVEYPSRTLKTFGVVLQSDCPGPQAISTDLKSRMLRLLPLLAARGPVKVVCNYIQEFFEFSSTLEFPVSYSYDAGDYYSLLSDCDMVITTRLHSALIANSLLKPAIVTNRAPRLASAADLCPHISLLEPEAVPGFLDSFDAETEGKNLLNWKRRQEADYLELLRSALHAHGLH